MQGQSITRLCPTCHCEFATTTGRIRDGRGIYCSQACYWAKAPPVTLLCEYCANPFPVYGTRERQRRRFCSSACANAAALLLPEYRFWLRVKKLPGAGCWLWLGANRPGWHGVVIVHYQRIPAHQYAFTIACGCTPAPGFQVNHHCDTPLCVRPDHLYIGTQAENMQDMCARGRHGNAKLTEAKVVQILTMLANGVSQCTIAQQMGTTQTTVSGIKCGKAWRHVTHPAPTPS